MDTRCRFLTIAAFVLALVTGCTQLVATPTPTPRTYRIAYLGSGGDPRLSPNGAAFVEGMSHQGYVVDQNLSVEFRWADGKTERLPELARELASLKLDAVFAGSELPAQALLEADPSVPIVMVT